MGSIHTLENKNIQSKGGTNGPTSIALLPYLGLKNSFCLPFLFVTPSLLPLLTSSSLTFLLPFLLLLSLLLVSPSTLSSQPFPRAPLCIILGVFFPGCSIQETHDFVLDRLIPLFFLFKKKTNNKITILYFFGL